MDTKDLDLFLTHAKTSSFQQQVKETENNMTTLFAHFSTPSISVSGGKDSLVLLALALKINPNCFVWHWDYGPFMLRKYEIEVQSILASFSILPGHLTIEGGQAQEYRDFFASLRRHIEKHIINLSLVGLRAEESCKRKVRLRNLMEWHHGTRVITAFPLRNWSYIDIWAYICSHKMSYPSAYDVRRKLHEWADIRFVTFFDPEFDKFGAKEQDNFLFWKHKTIYKDI